MPSKAPEIPGIISYDITPNESSNEMEYRAFMGKDISRYLHLRVWIERPQGEYCFKGTDKDGALLYLRSMLKTDIAEIEKRISANALGEAVSKEINVTGDPYPPKSYYIELAVQMLRQIKEGHGFIHPHIGRDLLRLLIRLLGADPDELSK